MTANKQINFAPLSPDTYSLTWLVPRNYSQQVCAVYLKRYSALSLSISGLYKVAFQHPSSTKPAHLLAIVLGRRPLVALLNGHVTFINISSM
jgi:hypothetical protein